MNPDRWAQLKTLFGEAIELDARERAAFISAQCGGDRELEQELLGLLERHSQPAPAMDRPPMFDLSKLIRTITPGEVLAGRYRVTGFLGQGGMGEVYRVHDEQLGVEIALKTLRPETAMSERAAAAFRREVLLLREVTHPNVCRVFDYGHDRLHFFTMELLEGETLASVLRRRGRLPVEEAAPLVRQILEGLSAAHARSIIHRDLKPGNILITADRAVITDFGVARRDATAGTGPAQTTDTAIGTPLYMAPEQIEGGKIDARSDLYSLGVMMYEMLSGEAPWAALNPLALAGRKLHESPTPIGEVVPGLPARWSRVIAACLAVNPAHRPASAQAVLEALEGTGPAPRPRSGQSVWKRIGWPGAVAAVLASSLAVAGAVYFMSRRGADAPAEALAAMREQAWQRAEALLRNEGGAESRARYAETLLELDRLDEAKDLALELPASPRADATRLLVQRKFDAAAAAFHRLARTPLERLDACRVEARGSTADRALACYDGVLKDLPDHPGALLQSGILLGRRRDVDKAVERFDRAEARFRLLNNLEGVAEARLRRAAVLQHQKRWPDTAKSLAEVLALCQAAGLDASVIRLHFALAVNAAFAGNLADGVRQAEAGLALAREKSLPTLAAQGENDLGSVLLTQYKLKEAKEAFERALAEASRARSAVQEARARLSLASVATRNAQPVEAIPLIRAALKFYERAGFRDQVIAGRFLMVDAQLAAGAWTEATEALDAIERDAGATPDQVLRNRVLDRRLTLATARGDWTAAMRMQDQLIERYTAAGQKQALALAWLNRAELACQSGGSGWDWWQKGAAAGRALDATVSARAGIVEAECALRQRDLTRAEKAARRVLAMDGGGSSPLREARALATLSVVHKARGDAAGAARECGRAMILVASGASARSVVQEFCGTPGSESAKR